MTFGEKLKELRLKRAKKGLREFAKYANLKASELSRIERGLDPPPSDEKWLFMIADKLGLTPGEPAEWRFYEAWGQPFVMKKMDEFAFPLLVHDADGAPLSRDKLEKLANWLHDEAVAHNKRADEYNREHSVE